MHGGIFSRKVKRRLKIFLKYFKKVTFLTNFLSKLNEKMKLGKFTFVLKNVIFEDSVFNF